MRIIAGKARGVKLRSIDGQATRPTADRVRESLFNMLAPDLPDCAFLDLFSGTGAVGIEALSRGAKLSVFVDNSPAAAETIKQNLIAVKLVDSAVVFTLDFKRALNQLSSENQRFDIIFLDPPYNTALVSEAMILIAESDLLNEGGYIVAEVERGTKIESTRFEVIKSRDYGSVTIVFLRESQK